MTDALRRRGLAALAAGALLLAAAPARPAELPVERPLWKDLGGNPIVYDGGEKVRTRDVEPWAPSGRCRAFSQVSVPTYSIHSPADPQEGGAGLVLCPGGGYRDVWLDWEGHDIALWLARRGVTTLVLKYRTNERREGAQDYMDRVHDWDAYLPEVVSDAKEAVRLLRGRAGELGLDPGKIGVAGFSAGGHLAFSAAFDRRYWKEEYRDKGHPDFVGLFYPWLWDGFEEVARNAPEKHPVFIFNGGGDRVTPPGRCVDLCAILLGKGVPAELHIFAKGGHGFAMGEGAGRSAAQWLESFVSWMEDQALLPASGG